jgi:hypothetical protein
MTVETRLGLLKFIEICTEMNLSSQGFPLDDLHIYQKHLKTVKSLNAFPEVEKTTWKIIVKKYDMTISLPAEVEYNQHVLDILTLYCVLYRFISWLNICV